MSFHLISWGMGLVTIFLMFVVGNAVYNRTKEPLWGIFAAWAVAAVFAFCLCRFASWHMRQETARVLQNIERRQHRRQEAQPERRAVERSGAAGRCRCMED